MKKILFFAAALAVVSLASCGKGDKAAEAVDSDTVVVAEEVVSAAVDTVDSVADTVVTVAAEVAEGVVPAAK